MLDYLRPIAKEEEGRLVRRLDEIAALQRRLEQERATTQQRLEKIRLHNVACPKCGRDKDFLTDEGGFLAHVLEDPDDRELLSPGKPLYCPDCGEVFLFGGPIAAKAPPKSRKVAKA